MPKSTKDAEIVLALAAASFDPRLAYSEAEVNEHLAEWLAEFTSPIGMDHVTVRRYLIDYCFLLRDVSGTTYTTNQTIINLTIEPAARSIQPRLILEELERERRQRKQAATT